MSLVREIRTWRVYPRVHYFRKRYNELLPRFHRVTKAFPESFQDTSAREDIQSIDKWFVNSLKLIVCGSEELKLENLVVTTAPLNEIYNKELQLPSKNALIITHIQIASADIAGLEILEQITALIDYTRDKVNEGHPDWLESYFVVIDMFEVESDSLHSLEGDEKSSIRDEIAHYLTKMSGNAWKHKERIVFGSRESALASLISEFLEAKLIEGFYKVFDYLGRFLRVNKTSVGTDVEIVQSEFVIRAIQGLLRDDIGLADMRKMAEEVESEKTRGCSPDTKFVHQLLEKLARLIKCSVVNPFSAKCNLPAWIVNQLLEEVKFEEKVMEAISKNTKYHLSKLKKKSEGHEKFKSGQRTDYRFDYIVYPIQDDTSKVISEAEKTMASAHRIVTIMEKMIFEVEGYLEQTIVERLKYTPNTVTPIIPKGLREEILRMKGVYGVGIVFNSLEIHLKEEKTDVKETDSKTDPDAEQHRESDKTYRKGSIEEAASKSVGDFELEPFSEDRLRDLMKYHSFSCPYKVKYVAQEPVKMMADVQHENGKLIKSPKPDNVTVYRSGTLGAFVEGQDKQLYALTCAHVVCNPAKDEHDVFIQDRGVNLKKIGVSLRSMTLCSGSGSHALVDLSAIRVAEDMVGRCIKRIKDDSGLCRHGRVAEESFLALRKKVVYKHGAFSGLTYGLVCGTDFGLFDAPGEDSYVLLIEALPGGESLVFSKRGDSGSIICMPDLFTNNVKVVAMLSSGDYKVKGDNAPKYLSFLMRTGLEKMRDVSSVNLQIP